MKAGASAVDGGFSRSDRQRRAAALAKVRPPLQTIAGYSAKKTEQVKSKYCQRHSVVTEISTNGYEPDEFMRRFLLHVLPSGFHRIRHYRLIANNARKENLALARELLQVAPVAWSDADSADAPNDAVRANFVCSHCGAPMVIIQTLTRERAIRGSPQDQGVS